MSYIHADGGATREGVFFDENLWGVYIRGVDEWHAAASRAEAEQHANALNTALLRNYETRGRHGFDPVCWAVPDFWPFDPVQHDVCLAIAKEEQAAREARKQRAEGTEAGA